jgi:rare lipoprotein A (peptidoglycan hydrolase)
MFAVPMTVLGHHTRPKASATPNAAAQQLLADSVTTTTVAVTTTTVRVVPTTTTTTARVRVRAVRAVEPTTTLAPVTTTTVHQKAPVTTTTIHHAAPPPVHIVKPKRILPDSRVGTATWYWWHPGQCASPWLPKGTRVWIRDLSTGKIVSCLITDREADNRGGRVVDMDARLFEELAPLPRGVVRVKVMW